MLSQAKIDLAVLLKLFLRGEAGNGAGTPEDIARSFHVSIPFRRVTLALEKLEERGEVERKYHPFHFEEGLWEISRGGVATIERAVAIPESFISRHYANGDVWLLSDEAEAAVLNRNWRYEASAPAARPRAPLLSSAAPDVSAEMPADAVAKSANRAGWFGAWGTWAGVVIAVIALWLTYLQMH